jgi:predicted  nucleic acid-binding Zn-ribbon protein
MARALREDFDRLDRRMKAFEDKTKYKVENISALQDIYGSEVRKVEEKIQKLAFDTETNQALMQLALDQVTRSVEINERRFKSELESNTENLRKDLNRLLQRVGQPNDEGSLERLAGHVASLQQAIIALEAAITEVVQEIEARDTQLDAGYRELAEALRALQDSL